MNLLPLCYENEITALVFMYLNALWKTLAYWSHQESNQVPLRYNSPHYHGVGNPVITYAYLIDVTVNKVKWTVNHYEAKTYTNYFFAFSI